MFCEATANPEATLVWYKDGEELIATDRVIFFGVGRIQIRHLRAEDGGVYICTFRNLVGQVSHVIKFIIEGNIQSIEKPNTLINCRPTAAVYGRYW